MRTVLNLFIAFFVGVVILGGCGRTPAPPNDPSIPVLYVETWCRESPTTAQGISFVVTAPIGTPSTLQIEKRSNGSAVTSATVTSTTLDASQLQYGSTGIQMTVQVQGSPTADKFSGAVTDTTQGGAIQYVVICRSLKLDL